MVGDRHIITYSGIHYSFINKCEYTLTEDALDKEFKITTKCLPTGYSPTCLLRIVKIFRSGTAQPLIKLIGETVFVNNVQQSNIYTDDKGLTVKYVGLMWKVVSLSDIGIKVFYDTGK